MHELDIWVSSFHVHSPNAELTTLSVPGKDGSYLVESKIGIRDVDIELLVESDSLVELDDKKHLIYDLFYSREPFTIIRDFKNLELSVIQEGSYDIENITCSDGEFDITLKMLDPYLYGPEKTLSFPADIVTFDNNGTAEADPIFELTAKKKTTFAMISNGDNEYNLIGKPADVDEQLVDEKTLIFSERGETLNTWSDAGTQFDNGKVTGGQLGTDGTGIHPLTYGDPGDWEGWYGPALMKEISPIQDFEVEMRLRADTDRPDQLYRIEFYLYDENMNVLGKMAVRDFSLTMDRYAAEGRFGPFLGAGRNYLISQENYIREGSHFHGMVRMRRVGQEFEFYVARLRTGENEGRHHDILKQTFHDVNNEYQGKLRYVQINIARNTQGRSANVPRINAISAYELRQATVDQTPYILNAGDKVLFDHKDDDILVNGEPRNDLKNFGGSFFKLKKGENMIIVSPEDTFDTKVTFRDKYL